MSHSSENDSGNSNNWDTENGGSPSEAGDQSELVDCVTSSKQQVDTKETVEQNHKLESVDLGSPNSERSCSPMASSERHLSPASISFADLPKAIASNSYLAAALKASVASSSAPSGVLLQSDSLFKQGGASPPESPPSGGSLPKGGTHKQQHINSLIKSPSLGDISNSAQNHLNSMIQGIPLLSSVLPALQRLTPASLSSLQALAGGGGSGGGGGILCVCGVKFSSSSNLEAHRLFYCSHRQVSSDSRTDRKETSPTRDTDEGSSSPTSGGRILKCPHCPYTTTHKLSLNGHMNIHTNPEDSSSQSSSKSASLQSSVLDPRAPERYCSDCDIQFSSMKTFRVHKAHYCQTRHVLKGSKSPAREDVAPHGPMSGLGGSSGGASGPPGSGTQPVLALATNPVLLLPYSMVAGAQLLPPHILPQLGAAFVLPNGQVHPIPSASSTPHSAGASSSLPPLLSPGAIAAATAAILSASSNAGASPTSTCSTKADHSSSSSSQRSKSPREEEAPCKRRGDRGESPLDLTTKRPKLAIKTDLLSDEEKENRETLNSAPSSCPSFEGGGEFEGKLLSSPPRASPPSDADDRSLTKSPRPASAAPSLSSPRGHPDSPKPSTSVISISSRSPGHSSPVASTGGQNLPPLPGFPLVNNLEALSASLPLASLQCLQSLQNVPRELALKLINPELLMNGLPPPVGLNPPVIVKQGEAKCNECNIVFYKEESLQIHKKHYCSARESNKPADEERTRSPNSSGERASTPLRSPVRDTPSTVSQSAQKDSAKPAKALLQFICTACGIKFSSPDNLAAHQTYYCPKREGASEEAGSKGVWRCPRCRVVMVETLQAAHQCVSPAPTPSHGWKCPCCPVLSPTAAAAQKHLETHAGIKAFRCTICGYRGNTLRGMRTHIRMHFEKRTNDLQEENFIACILEDEDHRGRGGVSVSSSEARKLIDSTRLLLENTALSALLGGENPLSDPVDPPLSCAYCPFITPGRAALLQHLTIVHKAGLEATSLSQEIKNLFTSKLSSEGEGAGGPGGTGNTSTGNTTGSSGASGVSEGKKEVENGAREPSPPVASIKLEPEVKLEVHETEEEIPHLSTTADDGPRSPPSGVSLSNGSPSNGQCYCHACNISFSMLDSYVAHKRFYCTRPESNTPPETTVQ